MTPQEILFIVAIVFFVLAALCIGLAVAVFFIRNIPDVRADLSGKKRATAVAEIAAQRSGRDRRKGVARVEPTSGRLDSGNLHESSPLDNPLNQVPHVESVVSAAPGPAEAQEPQAQEPARQHLSFQPAEPVADRTAEQSDDSATSILADDSSSTVILPDDDGSTSILDDDDSATDILPEAGQAGFVAGEADDSATTMLPPEGAPAPAEGFVIVRKIVLRESENVVTAS